MQISHSLPRLALLLLMLPASRPAAAAAPARLSWEGSLPAATAAAGLLHASQGLILGEGHGHLGGLSFYRNFLSLSLPQADGVLIEWVYRSDQELLDAFLQDKSAVAGSAKESYYVCRLARLGLRARPENAKLSEAEFRRKFSRELSRPAELTEACDHHDAMLESLRAFKTRQMADPAFRVCALDYDERTQPVIRFEQLSDAVKALRGNPKFAHHFGQTEKADRELVLADNILSCLQGRTRPIGIVGVAHSFSGMATGMVKAILNRSRLLSVVAQITPVSGSEIPDEENCDCILDSKELKAQLFELKESLALLTKQLTPEQRSYIDARDDGEAKLTDALIFHRPALLKEETLSPRSKAMVEKYFSPE